MLDCVSDRVPVRRTGTQHSQNQHVQYALKNVFL